MSAAEADAYIRQLARDLVTEYEAKVETGAGWESPAKEGAWLGKAAAALHHFGAEPAGIPPEYDHETADQARDDIERDEATP
jgi:hypothetical protein